MPIRLVPGADFQAGKVRGVDSGGRFVAATLFDNVHDREVVGHMSVAAANRDGQTVVPRFDRRDNAEIIRARSCVVLMREKRRAAPELFAVI